MKAKVIEDRCIGCGSWQAICDEVFDLEDGVARVIKEDIEENLYDDVRDAAENCPTEAIEVEEN